MAYPVSKGKVTSGDVAPPEEPEDAPDPHSVTLPLAGKCPHGFYNHDACWKCNPAPSYPPEKKQLPVVVSLYTDVSAMTSLKIGDLICRRIRPEVIGVVKSISYAFIDSKHIRDVWIDFNNSGRSTPYTPDELLTPRIQ